MSSDSLIRAAKRNVKEQTGLDLDACTRWLRFLEVHYLRSGGSAPTAVNAAETSVIFVVDAEKLVPSLQDWPQVWQPPRLIVPARGEVARPGDGPLSVCLRRRAASCSAAASLCSGVSVRLLFSTREE
jgi:DBC1